jgi:ERF superfamily
MSSSNAWAEFSTVFCRTRGAYLEHENAKAELKGHMPEDTKEAYFASRPSWRIRLANGSPRNGPYATSPTSRRRMGAALTYARRYALFALVGIAGEDDLDAPDLDADPSPAAELARPSARSNGQAPTTQRKPAGDGKLPSVKSVLGEQLSGSLRESLIEQLDGVNSADEAAAWAHRNLPAKNTLTAADAKMVEERFKARLSTMCDSPHPDGPSEGPPLSGTPEGPLAPTRPPHALAEQGAASAADLLRVSIERSR